METKEMNNKAVLLSLCFVLNYLNHTAAVKIAPRLYVLNKNKEICTQDYTGVGEEK